MSFKLSGARRVLLSQEFHTITPTAPTPRATRGSGRPSLSIRSALFPAGRRAPLPGVRADRGAYCDKPLNVRKRSPRHPSPLRDERARRSAGRGPAVMRSVWQEWQVLDLLCGLLLALSSHPLAPCRHFARRRPTLAPPASRVLSGS